MRQSKPRSRTAGTSTRPTVRPGSTTVLTAAPRSTWANRTSFTTITPSSTSSMPGTTAAGTRRSMTEQAVAVVDRPRTRVTDPHDDYNGMPHVFYLEDWCNGPLRHGWWDGSRWHFETLDGAGGARGRVKAAVCGPISVVLYDGVPHVFYSAADATGHAYLRHTWYGLGGWNFEASCTETEDGTGGRRDSIEQATGRSCSMACHTSGTST